MNETDRKIWSENFKSFLVMAILEKAGELEHSGHEVIHLEIGEPDFPTPECVKEAAIKAIRDGRTGYTHSLGLIELREALSEYYLNRYRVNIHPDRFIVTPGTSPAMLLAMYSIAGPGDTVLLTDPHYACYPNFVRITGAEPVFRKVDEKNGFHLSHEALDDLKTLDVKGVMINSPSNPAGTLLDYNRMKAICETGITILSDEIYHGLVYEGREHSALEFTDNCFVFNGFSKLYAMTGWRLGYMIAPEKHIPFIQKLQQSFIISTNTVSQIAGITALRDTSTDTERMKAVYAARRKRIIERLRAMGFTMAVEPQGAFYIFVNANHLGSDSVKLAYDILEKVHVGVTPGRDFGAGGEGFLRFSYANSIENIDRGMDRLESYIAMIHS